jgi:spermidine synthase
LHWYAALEAGIGLYSLFIPALFALLTRVYVAVYHEFHPGPGPLVVIRFALAAAPILIPSFLMGGTLPVLTRYLTASHLAGEAEINRLYGWNTVGAALGTLLSTYLLMPVLGVNATIWAACAADFAIAAVAFYFAVPHSGVNTVTPAVARHRTPPEHSGSRALLFGFAFFTGAVALGYEVVWSHVQAFTIGSTVYAFGTMLFTVLCGLGLGAQLVSRRLDAEALWAPALTISQLALGAVVLVTIPLWGHLTFVFEHDVRAAVLLGVAGLIGFRLAWRKLAGGDRHAAPLTHNRRALTMAILVGIAAAGVWVARSAEIQFYATELVRFFCCFFLLIIPALLLGMSFPLLLSMGGSGEEVTAASSVGTTYAANTLGAITGSLCTGFFVIPRLGSEMTLRGLADCNLLIGVAVGFTLAWKSQRKAFAAAALTSALLLLSSFALPRWDVRTLLRGSYVYFATAERPDRVLYSREDVQGGLTSVITTGRARVLLSNAKFQGDNANEVPSQVRFALAPAIFTRQYRRALVIGLGTGTTTRTVSLFPFQQIDVAELSPYIVEAARLWFPDVNGRVLDEDGRIRLHVTDGRNFLLLSHDQYDLITVEITSIWIAGEADLYNREFYQLCREHLSQGGVLQQWVQLHNMRTIDLLTIFNTAARVFPHLAFFVGPNQGVLLASRSPLAFDFAKAERLESDPKIALEQQRLHLPAFSSLLGEIMLYGESLHRAIGFLPDGGGPRSHYISSDSYPYLEYATPKDNALTYNTFSANLNFLRSLRPTSLPPDMPLLNVPSTNERNLILGYASEQQGNLSAAQAYFEAVQGPRRNRAQRELSHLTSRDGK